ncbi:hypothetical protein X474_15545 [Dethiosulfatarculus sandiegensis]|uniref:Uncharacterized protein n=1 Tax=Dethiosulfatarculus sandiegensis TaxID=1429043 RepID=A0A0D2JUH5_9BACT|nr:hypothetical protein X474_15545 [Dethiosulfatarculus sandiegensis]
MGLLLVQLVVKKGSAAIDPVTCGQATKNEIIGQTRDWAVVTSNGMFLTDTIRGSIMIYFFKFSCLILGIALARFILMEGRVLFAHQASKLLKKT